MPKEFIMRGQTTIAAPTEVLNITGYRPGYGYVIKEFQLYPSTLSAEYELAGSITADNSSEAPDSPNFNHDGLIATAMVISRSDSAMGYGYETSVVNDLFVITQDLILQVADVSAGSMSVNWQVRFKEVKLSSAAEAVANFKQYTIYNTSS